MQRYDFYFRQKVTEGELDAAFEAVEQFELNSHLAQGLVGVQSQGVVSEKSGTPNLTVDISGPAEVRDQLGQRINWTGTQNLDVSVDENSNPTAVGAAGNEKWLSVFAKFERALSDPRIDGAGATVQYSRAESFSLHVVQGAEATSGTATKPTLRADQVLLADVLLIFGQTQVLNGDISTTRREDAFVITDGASTLRAGTSEDALNQVFQSVSSALSGAVHLAGAETITGSKTFTSTQIMQALLSMTGAGIDFTGLLGSGSAFSEAMFSDSGRVTGLERALVMKASYAGQSIRLWYGGLKFGFEVSVGCDYDNSTSEWVSDTTSNASLLQLAAEVGLLHRSVSASGERWTDGTWTAAPAIMKRVGTPGMGPVGSVQVADGYVLFFSNTATGSNLALGTAPTKNAVHAKSFTKVWGRFSVGGGGPGAVDGFGIATITGTTTATITFSNNFANTNYAFVSQPFYNATIGAVMIANETSRSIGSMVVELRRVDTGAVVSMQAAGLADFVDFAIRGEQ